MFSCNRTDLNGVKTGIDVAYDKDFSGLKKYKDPVSSINVLTIADAVNETVFKMSCYENENIDLLHYCVYCNGNIAGYVTCFYDFRLFKFCLVSFGINHKYRTMKRLEQYFKLICNITLGSFYCVLFSCNTRAIKWLNYNGMKIYSSDDEKTVLIYNF